MPRGDIIISRLLIICEIDMIGDIGSISNKQWDHLWADLRSYHRVIYTYKDCTVHCHITRHNETNDQFR